MNNLFMVIGRITRDLELRETKNGKKILELKIAINNGQDDTTFLTAILFNQLAENTNKYCEKGSLVQVSGLIKNHNWDDKDGNKHYDMQFLANNVLFLETKKKKQEQQIPQNIKTEYDNIGSSVKVEESGLPF